MSKQTSAAYNLLPLQLSDADKCKQVQAIINGLIFTKATIERIKNVFKSEMELALNMQESSLQMENTYIPELLDGTENGVYLAMDLGGTNLRVMLVELYCGQVICETVKHYALPDALRIGCGTALFDHLAKCVQMFISDTALDPNVVYPLGFTFSFPMRQHGLDSGVLVTWTKSFNCPSVVGQDAVKKLRESLARCNCHNVEVLAILNDTTGTLMHGALLDRRTRMGIVLGTGSNGCYMELAERVKHWESERHGERYVIVDVEWGAFGDNGCLDFIKTEFDRAVDDGSLLPKSFTFEKYIGGKYLGELCRVILKKLYEAKLFMAQLKIEHFPAAWTFGSDNVSIVEHDTINNEFEATKRLLEKHFPIDDDLSKPNNDDLNLLRYVCGVISMRAAQLLGITTSILLNRMDDDDDIVVAIDGSVYKHHERLRYWLGEYTKCWASTKQVTFILAEDGSGKGAALVAAIANKLRKRFE